MNKKKLAFVLGIRPDIIRASLILDYLRKSKDIEVIFIWSGQHYSDNLKGIFFRELDIIPPAIELDAGGDNDADTLGKVISKLYLALENIKPDACVFLGDTNTVASCIAPALLNIPIVHIEGGMRSYDWRMPEEKYRTISDHLADHIYVYFEEYKQQLIREGKNPKAISVVGNPIVDVLGKYYFQHKKEFDKLATAEFFSSKNLVKGKYLVMTCHRRENVHIDQAFDAILRLVNDAPYRIYFLASYRTQQVIKERNIKFQNHVTVYDPIGYKELLTLMLNSAGVLTDSGTVVEEACVLGIPSIQMRHSTERPQVYDVKSSVKFDPMDGSNYPSELVYKKLKFISNHPWQHQLGDGKTSKRIAQDLIKRLLNDRIKSHRPTDYHFSIERSYQNDGIKNQ